MTVKRAAPIKIQTGIWLVELRRVETCGPCGKRLWSSNKVVKLVTPPGPPSYVCLPCARAAGVVEIHVVEVELAGDGITDDAPALQAAIDEAAAAPGGGVVRMSKRGDKGVLLGKMVRIPEPADLEWPQQ